MYHLVFVMNLVNDFHCFFFNIYLKNASLLRGVCIQEGFFKKPVKKQSWKYRILLFCTFLLHLKLCFILALCWRLQSYILLMIYVTKSCKVSLFYDLWPRVARYMYLCLIICDQELQGIFVWRFLWPRVARYLCYSVKKLKN